MLLKGKEAELRAAREAAAAAPSHAEQLAAAEAAAEAARHDRDQVRSLACCICDQLGAHLMDHPVG